VKAVILAGGEGTRLRPLTCNLPKPMVPILNRPYLEHLLLRLKQQKMEEVSITLSYLPEIVEDFFGTGTSLGLRLSYSIEEYPLGTAGAIKKLEHTLNDTFAVLNGDIFTDLDLRDAAKFHREKGAIATIVLTPVENPSMYGVVEADASGRVKRFLEKPGKADIRTAWVNAGTYILEPQVLQYIPPDEYYMFERGLFPYLLEQGLPVYCYPSKAYWMDLGTPRNYMRLHRDILLGETLVQPYGEMKQEGVWMGLGCRVALDANIRPPVVLGPGCIVESKVQIVGPTVIGADCIVGLGSVVDNALLWDRVNLGSGVTITGSILGQNVVIGDNVDAGPDCILADGVVVGHGNNLGEGLIVWPDKRLEPNTLSRD
jgi:mannose-1-phosphate guanylyltransferase